MEKKLIGTMVTMMIMAHETESVGKVVTPEGESDTILGKQNAYLVETTGEDGLKAIKVTVVDNGAPFVAELTCEGNTTVYEGSAEGLIEACEGYLQAW